MNSSCRFTRPWTVKKHTRFWNSWSLGRSSRDYQRKEAVGVCEACSGLSNLKILLFWWHWIACSSSLYLSSAPVRFPHPTVLRFSPGSQNPVSFESVCFVSAWHSILTPNKSALILAVCSCWTFLFPDGRSTNPTSHYGHVCVTQKRPECLRSKAFSLRDWMCVLVLLFERKARFHSEQ